MPSGIECERCHGPGSEYMDARVMTDPGLAMQRGLMMPDGEVRWFDEELLELVALA